MVQWVELDVYFLWHLALAQTKVECILRAWIVSLFMNMHQGSRNFSSQTVLVHFFLLNSCPATELRILYVSVYKLSKTQLVTGCQFEKELFTTVLWVQPVSQVPTHHTDHLSRLECISFSSRSLWEVHQKP